MTLGILAGGQGARLGGYDKALATFRGETLLSRSLHAMGPGFAQVLVSYNRPPNAEVAGKVLQLVPDLRPNFPGPLAGIEALLAACSSDWLLTVPVDLREIPPGIPEILADASELAQGRGVRIADTEGLQPLLALWPVEPTLEAVTRALDAGEGSVKLLQEALNFRMQDISPSRLGNLNLPADFG